jgi:hypothetical protein
MINSLIETSSGKHEIELILRIDVDEDKKPYEDLNTKECPFLGLTLVFGNSTFPNLSVLWNECLQHSAGDIIQMGGDDLIYSTKNWDELVVQEFKSAFPNGIGFVYGPDGIFYSNLGTHGFVSRLWVDTLGYFTPPQGFTYYNDNWIFEIAKGIGKLHYVDKLFINHCRYPADHGTDPNYGRMLEYHPADGGRFNSDEMVKARHEEGQRLLSAEIPNYWAQVEEMRKGGNND